MDIGKYFVPKINHMFSIFALFFWIEGTCAAPSEKFWQDDNGCSYCLHGTLKGGKCVNDVKKEPWNFLFEINTKNNQYLISYGYTSGLQVFCKNEKNYCTTINDPMVVKAMPSLKERKRYCSKEKDIHSKYFSGMYYSIPLEVKINEKNVNPICDFVSIDYEKSTLKITNKGICPIWVMVTPKVLYLYNLNISKKKTYNLDLQRIVIEDFRKKIFFESEDSEKRMVLAKDFFSIGKCKNSICEILNYRNGNPREISIDCNFMKKSESQLNNVKILGEGVCSIEITQEEGKIDTVYVRSIKAADGYEALMSTRESYEKELKKLKER